MGGAESEISDATRDLLLEAAVFDPLSIRTTARALGMASESSYRFERRVDPRGTDWASRRACQLILQAAGGRAARGACSAGKFTRRGGSLPTPAELTLRVARIEKVLGLAIPAETAAQILARLELEVLEAGPETIRVRVPSWRPDLEREIDLVEEVARHHGYEKVPDRPHIRVAHTRLSKAERVRQAVSEVLTGAGYFEAVSYSFTTGEKAARLAWAPAKGEPLALRGAPLVLRESVLVGLLDALRVNSSAGEERPRLFEIARRFVPKGSGLPEEDTMLALAAMDDFAGVKGAVEAVLERLRVGGRVRFAAAEGRPDLEPGESADLFLDGRPLGVLGRVTKEAAAVFGLDEPPTVAELIYDRLIEAAALEPQYRPCPAFPAIVRDLALVLDEEVAWETVEAAARAAGVAELESVRATEVYRGQQVPAGKKSLVIRLVLRRSDETLRHEDADAMQARVLAALQERVGAVLRK
jgi:phenylalanyl-tRNA synthetase beta chain